MRDKPYAKQRARSSKDVVEEIDMHEIGFCTDCQDHKACRLLSHYQNFTIGLKFQNKFGATPFVQCFKDSLKYMESIINHHDACWKFVSFRRYKADSDACSVRCPAKYHVLPLVMKDLSRRIHRRYVLPEECIGKLLQKKPKFLEPFERQIYALWEKMRLECHEITFSDGSTGHYEGLQNWPIEYTQIFPKMLKAFYDKECLAEVDFEQLKRRYVIKKCYVFDHARNAIYTVYHHGAATIDQLVKSYLEIDLSKYPHVVERNSPKFTDFEKFGIPKSNIPKHASRPVFIAPDGHFMTAPIYKYLYETAVFRPESHGMPTYNYYHAY